MFIRLFDWLSKIVILGGLFCVVSMVLLVELSLRFMVGVNVRWWLLVKWVYVNTLVFFFFVFKFCMMVRVVVVVLFNVSGDGGFSILNSRLEVTVMFILVIFVVVFDIKVVVDFRTLLGSFIWMVVLLVAIF